MRYSPADRSMVIRPFAANGRSREAETRASDIARSAGPATNAITTAAVTIVRTCDHYEKRIRSVPPELIAEGTPSSVNGESNRICPPVLSVLRGGHCIFSYTAVVV